MEDRSFERLASSRLIIRRFAAGDAEALAAYRSEPEVARYQYWDCPYSVREAGEFIGRLRDLAPGTRGRWFQFAVSLEPSNILIGDVGLRTDGREAELGFTLSAAYQGRGYATEAVRAVLQYAFVQLAMDRVLSRTDARNTRARRLLEGLGFRREGELPERVWFKETWATDLLYAQLESEWKTGALTTRSP